MIRTSENPPTNSAEEALFRGPVAALTVAGIAVGGAVLQMAIPACTGLGRCLGRGSTGGSVIAGSDRLRLPGKFLLDGLAAGGKGAANSSILSWRISRKPGSG